MLAGITSIKSARSGNSPNGNPFSGNGNKKKNGEDKTQKDADDKQDVGNEANDAAPNPTVDGAGQNAGDGANNAGKGVKGGPCGCFIAGTDVLTPSGLVDIETIDIGDLVMAWREDGTGYGSYPVSALIRPPSRVIWQLILLDAQGNIETFETTDDHPWHVKGGHVSEGHVEKRQLVEGHVGTQGNVHAPMNWPRAWRFPPKTVMG